VNPEGSAGGATQFADPLAVLVEKTADAQCSGDRLGGGLFDTLQEKTHPGFRVAVVANAL
jgi:hypothetical protein